MSDYAVVNVYDTDGDLIQVQPRTQTLGVHVYAEEGRYCFFTLSEADAKILKKAIEKIDSVM